MISGAGWVVITLFSLHATARADSRMSSMYANLFIVAKNTNFILNHFACEHKKTRRCNAPTRVSLSNQKRLAGNTLPFRLFDSPDTRGCKSHNIACAMLSTAGLLTYLSCHTFPTLWL
jgi:hypothetical protein